MDLSSKNIVIYFKSFLIFNPNPEDEPPPCNLASFTG